MEMLPSTLEFAQVAFVVELCAFVFALGVVRLRDYLTMTDSTLRKVVFVGMSILFLDSILFGPNNTLYNVTYICGFALAVSRRSSLTAPSQHHHADPAEKQHKSGKSQRKRERRREFKQGRRRAANVAQKDVTAPDDSHSHSNSHNTAQEDVATDVPALYKPRRGLLPPFGRLTVEME